MISDWTAYGLIITLGLVTYATRIGGHLILSRFGRLNPRLEAALDAVPAAVMTAIVAPMALATVPADPWARMLMPAASPPRPCPPSLACGSIACMALSACFSASV